MCEDHEKKYLSCFVMRNDLFLISDQELSSLVRF